MSSYHPALRATNYTSIQENINSAPSCAESCLDTFWERIVDACDSDYDWPCLCNNGPAGGWTAAQQRDWLRVADNCIAVDCSSEDISGVQTSRSNLSAFCSSVLNTPSSTSTSLISTPLAPSSITTSTSTMTSTSSAPNSTTCVTSSTKTSITRATASPTKVRNPFQLKSPSKATTFSPSKSWLILGALWLPLVVVSWV